MEKEGNRRGYELETDIGSMTVWPLWTHKRRNSPLKPRLSLQQAAPASDRRFMAYLAIFDVDDNGAARLSFCGHPFVGKWPIDAAEERFAAFTQSEEILDVLSEWFSQHSVEVRNAKRRHIAAENRVARPRSRRTSVISRVA